MPETQDPEHEGPLPRTREAVDWWLKKWDRQSVIEGLEPLVREDVERLIQANGGNPEGLDLGGRDLNKIDLGPVEDESGEYHPINLLGVTLSEANLQGATLAQANLQGAYLDFANLRDVSLNAAHLAGAKVFGAKLEKSSFLLANLEEADFSGADLQGVLLSPAYLTGANFSNADLRGAILDGNDLEKASFTGAKLQGADLTGCKLGGNNLEEVNLRDGLLEKADLRGTNLSRCDLRGANLARAQISPETNLEGVVWDKDHVSVLEVEQKYEAAIALYRHLKEWHERAGMSRIAGEFHYREREAARKAEWQRLGQDFKEYRYHLVGAWQRFRGKTGSG